MAKKGYEVSACDSLIEGKKFFRSHPIVVAGSSDEEEEFAGFVDFVRSSAGGAGGYLIRLTGDSAQGAEEPEGWEVDDVIGPDLELEALEVTFKKADEWLERRGVELGEDDSIEIISSGPASSAEREPLKTTNNDPTVSIEIEDQARENEVSDTTGQSEPEAPSAEGAASAVSIRRGNALRRPEPESEFYPEERSMPKKKTTKYQYDLLIENAPLAMAMFDREMRYVIANGLWRRSFDLVQGDVIGRRHFDIFSDVSERWQMLLDRAKREEREVVGEEFVEWPDGSSDWVRWTMRPWEDQGGESAGLVVSCGVITDERSSRSDQQFESGLAESLMNSGVTPLVVLDFDGRVVRCNRIAKRWGDWGAASGDDRFFWDAFAPAESRQAVHESFHGHAVAMQEDGEFTFPPVSVEAVRHQNGSQRLVAWTNTPRVGEGGVITGLVRVGVEIRDEDLPAADPGDAIQLDEEKVGELQDEWMDSFPLMCWRTNSRGKIKFFNRQWLDFRGRSALEECDNGWMDGLHEEDYDSLVHAFDTAAKTGARVNHVARMIGGDGQYRWLRFVSARDFSDLEGASDGFIGYCEDLGRTIRLESELSAARSRYDELLEDSTSAFRSKRSLEERIRELEGEMEQEMGRLSAERESAVSGVAEQLAEAERSKEAVLARATEQLAQVESEREGELAKLAAELEQAGAERSKALAELDEEKARLEGDHAEALALLEQRKDMQLAEALEEKGEELARLLEEKRLEFGRELEAKEANLKKSHEETQGEFAKREEFLKAELEEAADELARLRESSKRELEELASAHAEQGVQHAQGIASLKSDFEGAAAEREQLAIEVAEEKERQAERESELAKLRYEIDAAHQDRDAAVAERDRTEILPENAPFGMVLIARDGAILYSNPATDKIAGVDFNEFDKVEEWLMSQAPSGDEEEQERLLKLWRDGIWRHDGTKVVSMQTDEGLRELELRSKLLPDGQVLLTIVDMTDSLRAEEALRASEVKFRSIFYDSGVGMALVDKTGNIFDANPAQEKLLGYSRAELRKMHIEDCLSLEEISRTQELAKEMAEKRSRSGEMTISLQPKDRRPAWAHMNVSLVRDPDGEVIFAAYFFHDITKEREAISKEQQATSSLATSQAEKQALIETSPDLIIVAGPDGIVERVVPPVSFPLHVDHSMEGHSVAEVVPPIADDFPALAEAARASGGVETKAFSILQGDETFHFECRIARSGDLDSVIVIRDVTAAKLAEEVMRRQALTFANIRDAIIVSDLKGRIKDWNPAAEEMFGYSREEAIGKGLYALYDP
ncbi:MAG: PAS domain S-box protein, partial [Verrucomicrobiales bacterium]